MKLKLVAWNIWVDGWLDKWTDFLQKADADIICLQEVKDDDGKRDIIAELTKRGYEHTFAAVEQVWDGEPFRFGNAIFSKFPIIHSEKIQLETGERERAAAYAKIDVNDIVLNVFTTHLIHTHQQPSEEQEEQTNKLIAKLPNEKVVVMGDFNATPESASIQAMEKVLVNTDPGSIPTWSMYPEGCRKCKPQKVDTKLDYIFVSKDLGFDSFQVGQSDGSDHLPVLVMVEI